MFHIFFYIFSRVFQYFQRFPGIFGYFGTFWNHILKNNVKKQCFLQGNFKNMDCGKWGKFSFLTQKWTLKILCERTCEIFLVQVRYRKVRYSREECFFSCGSGVWTGMCWGVCKKVRGKIGRNKMGKYPNKKNVFLFWKCVCLVGEILVGPVRGFWGKFGPVLYTFFMLIPDLFFLFALVF